MATRNMDHAPTLIALARTLEKRLQQRRLATRKIKALDGEISALRRSLKAAELDGAVMNKAQREGAVLALGAGLVEAGNVLVGASQMRQLTIPGSEFPRREAGSSVHACAVIGEGLAAKITCAASASYSGATYPCPCSCHDERAA